jgi:XapX domain-containing protein
MGKIVSALFLGFLIGIGCRYFDIPLPSPPKLIGALVVLSMTLGYVGTNSLLSHRARMQQMLGGGDVPGLIQNADHREPTSHAN